MFKNRYKYVTATFYNEARDVNKSNRFTWSPRNSFRNFGTKIYINGFSSSELEDRVPWIDLLKDERPRTDLDAMKNKKPRPS
jgi:hypothetical protein